MSSPIQNVDSIDIIGKRKDGGADLVLVCSGPLDGSADTLQTLRLKLAGYVRAANSVEFAGKFDVGSAAPIFIYISCDFEINPAIVAAIEEFRASLAGSRIEIRVVKRME